MNSAPGGYLPAPGSPLLLAGLLLQLHFLLIACLFAASRRC